MLPATTEPFELFLIGDTGDISINKPDPVLETLKAHFNENCDSVVAGSISLIMITTKYYCCGVKNL